MFLSVSKLVLWKDRDHEKPRILLLAPAGVTPVNINGITIHFGAGIGIDKAFCPLSDKQRVLLRNKLSEVKMIIIDEISMVSSILFYMSKYFMSGHTIYEEKVQPQRK